MLDYLPLPSEPAYRPKVYKVQIKQYGLRKVIRVQTRKNGDLKYGRQKAICR